MRGIAQEFKEFIMRGNVVDLAVAVVIGAAFTGVVNSLVADMITPLIAAIGGQPNFSELSFTINGSEFMYGNFLNAVISFLIVAAVVFFFVVKPLNMLLERQKRAEETPDPTTTKCPYCMSEVPNQATRCAFCTSELSPSASAV
ncbi:MAG TPA: large conductance mechanosensitive channel protein MscL [Thermomicrobiales bacterium]|nr:large conductance mechanosensitive channel protein MscL [Thermomicrobiales bacterium]